MFAMFANSLQAIQWKNCQQEARKLKCAITKLQINVLIVKMGVVIIIFIVIFVLVNDYNFKIYSSRASRGRSPPVFSLSTAGYLC